MTERPVLGVSAVVRDDDGRVLLVLRDRGAYAGRWSLPGGKVEHGESLASALTREVLEETGLTVGVDAHVWTHEQLPGQGMPGHYVILVHRASTLAGEARAGDDAREIRWVDPADLHDLEVTPGLVDALRAARAGA